MVHGVYLHFNNISVIPWWSVLLVVETWVPGENHWPVTDKPFHIKLYQVLLVMNSVVFLGIFDTCRLKENVVISFCVLDISLKSISGALTVNSTFNIYIIKMVFLFVYNTYIVLFWVSHDLCSTQGCQEKSIIPLEPQNFSLPSRHVIKILPHPSIWQCTLCRRYS